MGPLSCSSMRFIIAPYPKGCRFLNLGPAVAATGNVASRQKTER